MKYEISTSNQGNDLQEKKKLMYKVKFWNPITSLVVSKWISVEDDETKDTSFSENVLRSSIK